MVDICGLVTFVTNKGIMAETTQIRVDSKLLGLVKKHIAKTGHSIVGFFSAAAKEKLDEAKMKDRLTKKYETFVGNIEWHIKTNSPWGSELDKCNQQLG